MKFPKLEVEARDRDEPMDSLIKSLLDEEQASKKQKKGDGAAKLVAPAAKQKPGKKTLAEIEEEEGGPVKESLVGMAQTKRAIKRKKQQDDGKDQDGDETEFQLGATERFEEVLQQEEEDGVQLEPFNLNQEREEGHFDEDGNYVERKRGEDEEDKDAWFESDEAKVVSEAVRARVLAQQRELAEAEKARRPPLTDRQIAQRKADMAALMQPGESVTRALKRLGDASGSAAAGLPQRAMGKRERARLLAQQQQQQAEGGSTDDAAAKQAREHFQTLTELADELLAEGEMEIYSESQESLTRSARMWLPQQPATAPGAAEQGATANGRGAANAAAVGDDDDDDDMFGDGDGGAGSRAAAPAAPPPAAVVQDDDEDMFGDGDGKGVAASQQKPGAAATSSQPAGATSAAAAHTTTPQDNGHASSSGRGPASAAPGAAAAAAMADDGNGDGVNYASWPIKELKRLLQERGVDPSGYVEKGELVAKVKEVLAAGQQEPAGPGGGFVGAFAAPPGYAFDPSSGYFYSADSGMYYDTTTGYYCQAATGKWFYFDSQSRQFVEHGGA